jgi:pimeloyl-ACP methyl ester carboxylesterase
MNSERRLTQPLLFGATARRLFGLLQQAQGSASGLGVLLCNPFGQEAIRAHRMWRVLAERMSRAGHAVLRFDYFGTGDSMGDDADGDLEGWGDDALLAHRTLLEHSGVDRVVWVGMRLGATISARAAVRPPAELRRLVLWDPVLEGAAYLSHLRRRHVASLERAFSLARSPAPSRLSLDPGTYLDEAIGFAISPQLRAQLLALTPERWQWPSLAAGVAVLIDPDDDQSEGWASMRAHLPADVSAVDLKHGTEWTAESAEKTSLVPTAALMQLIKMVGGAA